MIGRRRPCRWSAHEGWKWCAPTDPESVRSRSPPSGAPAAPRPAPGRAGGSDAVPLPRLVSDSRLRILPASALISPAARSSRSHSAIASPTSRRASCLAWAALSPIRVWAPSPASLDRRPTGSPAPGVAASLVSFSRSASRAKAAVSWPARLAALAMISSRCRSASPVTISNLLGFAAQSAWIACSMPARCCDRAVSKISLSLFSFSTSSPIWARCFSCRASTNSARAMAASETSSIRLACASSDLAASSGAFRRACDGGAEAGRLHIQRLGRHLQGAFGRFHGGVQLRGAARHGFAGAAGGFGELVAQGFDARAFLVEARGDGFAAHLGAGAGIVQRGDLIFQHRFQGAHALEGAIQTGVEAIEFAAHRARQPRGIVGGGFVGGEQPLAGRQQACGWRRVMAALRASAAATARNRNGGSSMPAAKAALAASGQIDSALRPQKAPDEGAADTDPEQRQQRAARPAPAARSGWA